MYLPINEEAVFKWTLLLIGVQIILSGTESLYKYKIYRDSGWLSWEYLRRRKMGFIKPGKWMDYLFAYPNVLMLMAGRVLLTVGMCWILLNNREGHSLLLSILVVMITTLGIVQVLRDRPSHTGADQVTNIILLAVCISRLAPPNTLIPVMSIIFIACQSELSYLTSGFFKFVHPDWRNGGSLKDIFSTETFGNVVLKRWMDKRPSLYRIGGYCVIFGELLLGCAFLFPPEICIWMLCGGALFHFSVAVVMGLNTFFWTFCATYPSIYFISQHHH